MCRRGDRGRATPKGSYCRGRLVRFLSVRNCVTVDCPSIARPGITVGNASTTATSRQPAKRSVGTDPQSHPTMQVMLPSTTDLF